MYMFMRQTPTIFYNSISPYAKRDKSHGMALDSKLKWNEHIKMKAIEFDLKINNHLYGSLRDNLQRQLKINFGLQPTTETSANIWGTNLRK